MADQERMNGEGERDDVYERKSSKDDTAYTGGKYALCCKYLRKSAGNVCQ